MGAVLETGSEGTMHELTTDTVVAGPGATREAELERENAQLRGRVAKLETVLEGISALTEETR